MLSNRHIDMGCTSNKLEAAPSESCPESRLKISQLLEP